ncbi:MAG: purine-nucleoside phosphorylase [Chloroflexi bacterium 13_1_40CM_4_68_4]|nr:MAG: purine-nucleoside phosphorylase [Chloroflexi bacterium 13_1_40CM_4_68_4]
MPIHIRAAPGDYADACLLPGDPLRAKYVAETFLTDARPRNQERGLLGFSGSYQGVPVSVQATGMGSPSAAIVTEELVQLGVKRLIRIGTCGALRSDLGLGDLIVASAAVPADGTPRHYAADEPSAPIADFRMVHAAVHEAERLGMPVRVGSVATSDVFYDPDPGRYLRWQRLGVLAVEMEAAVLFTVAALRGVSAACILTVSDVVPGLGLQAQRIGDAELRNGVAQMTQLALATVVATARG